MCFEDEVIADVKALAQGYARGHGGTAGHDGKTRPLKLKTVSVRLYGHALWLEDFLAGKRSASVSKIAGMVADFRADWPEGEAWPKLKRLFTTGVAVKVQASPKLKRRSRIG